MSRFLSIVCLCMFSTAGLLQAEAKKMPSQLSLQETNSELTELDALIKATENSLARQKKLRPLIEEYRRVEKSCIEKPNDTALLFKLAKQGKLVYEAIEESKLQDYFKPEFIQELQKLKAIGDKKSIPPAT